MNLALMIGLAVAVYSAWAWRKSALEMEAQARAYAHEFDTEWQRAERLNAELYQTRFKLDEAVKHLHRLETVAGKEFGFMAPTGNGRDEPEMFRGPSTAIYLT